MSNRQQEVAIPKKHTYGRSESAPRLSKGASRKSRLMMLDGKWYQLEPLSKAELKKMKSEVSPGRMLLGIH